MKYRIEIITYQSGRQEFYPSVRYWLGWSHLNHKGQEDIKLSCRSREEALYIIDLHHVGNNNIKSIDFEYINK